ncbi:MAG: hypothetical protein ABEH86_00535 [Haloarcula sp.]
MAFEWTCDYCGFTTRAAEKETVISSVKSHIRGEGGAILVYNTPDRFDEATACFDLLTAAPPPETGVLFITRSPELCLDTWVKHTKEWPKEVGILALDDTSLSWELFNNRDIINTVSDFQKWDGNSHKDLGQSIVTMISKLTEGCQHVSVCFDNFSSMIHNLGNKTTFSMTHVLNAKMHESGSIAHYHMIPERHIESTLHLFRQHFPLCRDLTADEPVVTLHA